MGHHFGIIQNLQTSPISWLGLFCSFLQQDGSNQVKIILGLGRWSGNSILSFIEDTSLPFPFFHKVNQKIMQKCDIEARTKSWIRRVDLNVKAYFAVLGIFSVLNIIYACLVR